jgi:hypothetical protein
MTDETQLLFIDTTRCEGDPFDFNFTVPQELIRCDPNTERLKITLVRWTCRHDWNVVRSPGNQFSIAYGGTTTTFTIPPGNYTYAQYASKIQTLLNAERVALGASSGVIIVEYDSPTNHLRFTFPNTGTRTFTFPSGWLGNYGMTQTVYTISNTVLESDAPMNFYLNRERLYIYVDGIHQPTRYRNLIHDNEGDYQMRGTKNLLAAVLINNYPFETILYENDTNTFSHYIIEPHLFGTLHFTIKTIDGSYADFLPDSHLILRVDKERIPDLYQQASLRVNEDIREYLRLMFVSQHLPADLPDDAVDNPTL